jgi:hypothetical protein
VRGTTAAILRQVESLGYATSVHRIRDYVEMHAVPLADSEHLVLVRDGDGDDDAVYRAHSRRRSASR